jgi:ATP-binding protein involved in chromosome partitioning
MVTPQQVLEELKKVKYPGFARDIVSFGMVKDIEVGSTGVNVILAPTTAREEVLQQIRAAVTATVSRMPGVPAVEVTLTAAEQPQRKVQHGPAGIPGVEHVIAVASGKGGVGKSTVAANLAIGLARLGVKTGLLDADIYGPSIPLMLGLEGAQPRVSDHRMEPVDRYGIRSMSIGYLVDRHTPMIWRGPMAGKAIEQLMTDVDWEGTEALVLDLPPGTGDIHISISQKIRLTGAIIVTTPQEVALIDAGKGVAMFRKVSVPILGLVENMSHFVCPHCNGQTEIFGSGGGAREAERLEIPLLGQIPIDPQVVLGGDEGSPVLVRNPESPAGHAFLTLAARVADMTGLRPSG